MSAESFAVSSGDAVSFGVPVDANSGVPDGDWSSHCFHEDPIVVQSDTLLMNQSSDHVFSEKITDTHESRVRKMMQGFGQYCPLSPTVSDQKTRELRLRLMLEELFEYADACGIDISTKILYVPVDGEPYSLDFNDLVFPQMKRTIPGLVDIADALADIRVTLTGSFLAHGIPMEAVTEEVDRNNLLKLANGRKCPDTGKFLKHRDHPKVDLRPILLDATIGQFDDVES